MELEDYDDREQEVLDEIEEPTFPGAAGASDKNEESSKRDDILDAKFGFPRITDGPERIGWLFNIKPVRTNTL
jgi:hypothetical protein